MTAADMPCAVGGCLDPRHVEPAGRVRSRCRPHLRMHQSYSGRRYRETHRERRAATVRRWHQANREHVAASVRMATERRGPAYLLRKRHRRRNRIAGVALVVRAPLNTRCGVCRGPLHHGARFPDDLATTLGHEPPLARLAELGAWWVIERPEHWVCNRVKGTRLDSEVL